MTTSIETLHVWDTVYSADSVEWCPMSPYRSFFVCGTYQLSQEPPAEPTADEEPPDKPAKRLGRLYLFSVSSSDGLSLRQTLDTPAILDMKWREALLAVADADGRVSVYKMADGVLTLETKCHVGEEGTLALSLDWSAGGREVVVSDSRGRVSLLTLTGDGLDVKSSWKAHDFEAWIAAFDYWTPYIVYTGGDDSKFRVYDTRLDGSSSRILSSDAHSAGVTSLHSHAGREYTLASGSYDETFCLWDTRSMSRPVLTECLGGGVWRLKWNPRNSNQLLAACMLGGFKVVACDVGLPKRAEIVASYNEHESLAYGSDWCHLDKVAEILPSDKDDLKSCCSAIIGTCSFYDHKLCVSAIKITSE